MTLYVEYPSPDGISGLGEYVNMDLVQAFGVSYLKDSDTFEIFVELTSSGYQEGDTGAPERIAIAVAGDNPTALNLKRQLMYFIKRASGDVLFVKFDGKQFLEAD